MSELTRIADKAMKKGVNPDYGMEEEYIQFHRLEYINRTITLDRNRVIENIDGANFVITVIQKEEYDPMVKYSEQTVISCEFNGKWIAVDGEPFVGDIIVEGSKRIFAFRLGLGSY